MDTIQKWIDDSDVYVLILGGRYGSIDKNSGLSYSELEYQYAASKNMPMFSIVLKEDYLYQKAASLGRQVVFEEENPNKYKVFKSLVMSKIVKQVDNIQAIESAIHSTLYDIQQDADYHLTGWIKGDSIRYDYSALSSASLLATQEEIINAIMERNIPQAKQNMTDFSGDFAIQLERLIRSPAGVLNSVERVVTLERLNSNSDDLVVTVTKYFDYIYVDQSHPFAVGFWATERQAKTYKKISLIIDGQDRTGDLNLKLTENRARGQFNCQIAGNPITLTNPQSKIVYVASYECPASEFFQSTRIGSLCKHFKADIVLGNDVKRDYALLCATFSRSVPSITMISRPVNC